ncbi:MAG: hypothetical protein Q4F95_01715 [Oscillospiraceae bacterium]|nr:hypothetical protein [Oscillospiraceae bacterium]
MKKISLIMTMVFVIIMCFPLNVYANMAAPRNAEIGSSVTLENNNDISVLSEQLDIKVIGSQADIVAAYKMKNTTDKSIYTPSMFLSPNIQKSGVKVTINGNDTHFTNESYTLYYTTKVKTKGWQYAVLNPEDIQGHTDSDTVDAVNFEMKFAPDEECDVVVSYTYQLGGYPDYKSDAKRGEIRYFLKPAAMWKDFSDLTINLYLDEDMPVIKSSNLDFKKLSERTYQYRSDTLPGKDMQIVIDENWRQNIRSTLRSPYMFNKLLQYTPFILIGAAIVFIIFRRIIKYIKRKKHRQQS